MQLPTRIDEIKTPGGGADSLVITKGDDDTEFIEFSETDDQMNVSKSMNFDTSESIVIGDTTLQDAVGGGSPTAGLVIDVNGLAVQCSSGGNRLDIGHTTGIYKVGTGGPGDLRLRSDGGVKISPSDTEAFTVTGSDETNDGMTADPETATEDAHIAVDIGDNSYQIPLYSA